LKNTLLLRRIIANCAAVLIVAAGYADAATQEANTSHLILKIKNDLDGGQAIIVYYMENNDKTDEQYADWSAYLNDFAAAHAKLYKVYAADESINATLEQHKLNSRQNYTLFMKRGSPSYFYSGVIVEPAVYTAVDNTYSGKAATDSVNAFLPTASNFALK